MFATKSAKKLCFYMDEEKERVKGFDVDMEVEDAGSGRVRQLNLFDHVDEDVY